MKFEDLKFNDMPDRGNNAIQAIIKYKNSDYQMSVVRHAGSYGFELERYELGIFKGDNMVSFPPITHSDDQVRGFLKPHQIENYINDMAELLQAEPSSN